MKATRQHSNHYPRDHNGACTGGGVGLKSYTFTTPAVIIRNPFIHAKNQTTAHGHFTICSWSFTAGADHENGIASMLAGLESH